MATQPNFWLDSCPPIEPELLFVPELSSDSPASSEEPDVQKVVLKVRTPFERKKLDLSIYSFNETPIGQSFEEISCVTKFLQFKYLSKDIGCVSLQVEDALPYEAAYDKMICCMKSSKRTNQKKQR